MLGSLAGQKTIMMAAETRRLDFENGRPVQPKQYMPPPVLLSANTQGEKVPSPLCKDKLLLPS